MCTTLKNIILNTFMQIYFEKKSHKYPHIYISKIDNELKSLYLVARAHATKNLSKPVVVAIERYLVDSLIIQLLCVFRANEKKNCIHNQID